MKSFYLFFLTFTLLLDLSCNTEKTIVINEIVLPQTGCISGNCQNNFGTYIWKNGNKYVGYWKDGKRNGIGTMTWANEMSFPKRGIKKKHDKFSDLKHNSGNYNSINSHERIRDALNYLGKFNQNEKNKKSKINVENNQYEGSWENDKMHGKGVMFIRPNYILRGIWKNGIFIRKDDSVVSD